MMTTYTWGLRRVSNTKSKYVNGVSNNELVMISGLTRNKLQIRSPGVMLCQA